MFFVLLSAGLCPAGVLLSLVGMESAPGSSEDLATKCRRALKSVVAKLTALPALDALVHQALPEGIMRMVLEQVRACCLVRCPHCNGQLLQHFISRSLWRLGPRCHCYISTSTDACCIK